MKPYQPSLAAPVTGLLILLLAVLLGGAAIGVLVALLSNLLYVIILFPLAMGWLGGMLVARAVRAGKIRHPGIALWAGILIAGVMVAAMWATGYLQYRSAQVAGIRSANPQAGQAEIEQQIDSQLTRATGQGGIAGFLLLQDQKGVAVGQLPGSTNSLFNLGPILSGIYWVLEVFFIAWLAASAGRKQAGMPFCEACGRWHGQEQVLGTLGAKRSKEALDLIQNGLFLKLGEELQTNPSLPNVGIFLAQCGPGCEEGEAFLAVRSQVRGSGGKAAAKDIATGMITHAQTQDVLRGIENRKALYGI